jgi:hypothetical protein
MMLHHRAVKQLFRDNVVGIVASIIITALSASSAPFWWPYLFGHKTPPSTQGVIGFSGGCSPYQIFAQNRWQPYGTAVRTEPDVKSKQVDAYPGNYSIAVDGWVHSTVAYTTNTPPWNSDVWFHLADGSGWVSFAGVRGVPTSQDITGRSPDGGQPAPMPPDCQGSAQ